MARERDTKDAAVSWLCADWARPPEVSGGGVRMTHPCWKTGKAGQTYRYPDFGTRQPCVSRNCSGDSGTQGSKTPRYSGALSSKLHARPRTAWHKRCGRLACHGFSALCSGAKIARWLAVQGSSIFAKFVTGAVSRCNNIKRLKNSSAISDVISIMRSKG
jgi:hypothetical protein